MNEIDRNMLLIKSIDRSATVNFSEYTGKWYVSSRLEICGDGMLSGITEHRDDPQAAVADFVHRLEVLPEGRRIALISADGRREWRWNGAAFAEQPIFTPPSATDQAEV